MDNEQRNQIIEVWKTTVEVQQHFNDISMRIRGMFVTILLALFAAIGFLLDKPQHFGFWNINIKFSTIIPLFGLFGTYLFYFMDRYWYHRLLIGSVKHGKKIEDDNKDEMPWLSLTNSIGKESPVEPPGLTRWVANRVVTHKEYKSTKKLHSDGKIELFYKSVVCVLVLTTIMLAAFGGVTIGERNSSTHVSAVPTTVTATARQALSPAASAPATTQKPASTGATTATPPISPKMPANNPK